MADTYWGYDYAYAHRTVPHKWSRENGLHFSKMCLVQDRKNFRACGDVLGEPSQALGGKANANLRALDNPVLERPASREFCCSAYGLRQRNAFTDTLRDCNPRPYSAGPDFVPYSATLRDARGRSLKTSELSSRGSYVRGGFGPMRSTEPHPHVFRSVSARPMSRRAQASFREMLKMKAAKMASK
ncbi:unnamed protein product [Amoebophrya sp. A25]|nr:unnamed protein product [Amoebophrya sp. A25]|eukprot:GSA25T00005545001.1